MIELRDYQNEIIRLTFAALREADRVIACMPTGTGKTKTAAEIVSRGAAQGRRILWLAHRTELIDQAADTLIDCGLTVGVISASSSRAPDPSLPIQVASIQTLLARDHWPEADLIVVDECHHVAEAAEEWVKIFAAYPGKKALGLTATPERGDGSGLGPIWERIVSSITVRQATMRGYLVPCEVIRPARKLDPGELAQEPIAAYLQHARGKQGFLFARTVEQATTYAAGLSAAGYPAKCLHAKTPDAERATALAAFRSGALKIITNVYVMTEGVDLPMADVCVLARGAGHAGIYLQMVGRVLRPFVGKAQATLIDLTGVTHLHGMPEDERLFSLDGPGIRLSGMLCRVCTKPVAAYPCPHCGYQPAEDPDAGVGGEQVITNDPLERFARKIAESPEQRWQTLLRWIAACELAGKNTASVFYKWKAVYQQPLNPRWYSAAVRGQKDAPPC